VDAVNVGKGEIVRHGEKRKPSVGGGMNEKRDAPCRLHPKNNPWQKGQSRVVPTKLLKKMQEGTQVRGQKGQRRMKTSKTGEQALESNEVWELQMDSKKGKKLGEQTTANVGRDRLLQKKKLGKERERFRGGRTQKEPGKIPE